MTLIEQWFKQVWNEGDEEAIDQLTAPDATAHGLRDAHGREIRDTADFKELYRQFRASFSDIRIQVEQVITEGDLSAARCSVSGRHTGFAFNRAATGRNVSFTGICMVRIRDGRIAESWNEFDFLTMLQQIDQPTTN